mmetsp:Transcript_25148/g.49222  ORF Transcript_25148/g.49222 Transcript_25148/m.49222 type:complete len:533 (-) Transcript_25148:163-1761(-)
MLTDILNSVIASLTLLASSAASDRESRGSSRSFLRILNAVVRAVATSSSSAKGGAPDTEAAAAPAAHPTPTRGADNEDDAAADEKAAAASSIATKQEKIHGVGGSSSAAAKGKKPDGEVDAKGEAPATTDGGGGGHGEGTQQEQQRQGMNNESTIASTITRLREYDALERKLRLADSSLLNEIADAAGDDEDSELTWASPGLTMEQRRQLYENQEEKRKHDMKNDEDDATSQPAADRSGSGDEAKEDDDAGGTLAVIEKIIKLSRSFVSKEESVEEVRVSFGILNYGIRALSRSPKRLLPTVAQLWPALQPHFQFYAGSNPRTPGTTPGKRMDTEAQVLMGNAMFKGALEVLETLSKACPDFLSRRFSKGVWQGLRKLLLAQATPPNKKSQEYAYATLQTLVAEVPRLVTPILPELVGTCYRVITSPADGAKEGATNVLIACASLNADLVWWQVHQGFPHLTLSDADFSKQDQLIQLAQRHKGVPQGGVPGTLQYDRRLARKALRDRNPIPRELRRALEKIAREPEQAFPLL